MKINILFATLILSIYCVNIAFAQEEDFAEYGELFEEEVFDDESSSNEDGNGNNIGSSNAENPFTLRGEHSAHIPVPINQDHFNYEAYPRAPRQENTLGFEYESKFVKTVFNLNADYWAVSSYKLQDSVNVNLGESYISLSTDNIDLSMGLLYYEWGSGLGINPTDKLNAFDFRYGMEPERIPNLSTSVKLYLFNMISLEGIYIPLYTSNIYPLNTVEVFKNNIQEAMREKGINVGALKLPQNNISANVRTQVLDFDPSQFQVGAKTSFYLSIADISLIYIYDIDDFYSIDERTDTLDILSQSFTTQYEFTQRRINRFGLDVMSTVGDATVWLETAFNLTEDYNLDLPKIRNHNLEWTLGTDFNIGKNNQGHIGIQQFGKYIFNYKRNIIGSTDTEDIIEYQNYILGQETEALYLGLLTNLDWKFLDDKIIPKLNLLYSFPLLYDEATYFRPGSLGTVPSIEFAPTDALTLSVGSTLTFAWIEQENGDIVLDEHHSFGQAANNNKVFLELRYKWAVRK